MACPIPELPPVIRTLRPFRPGMASVRAAVGAALDIVRFLSGSRTGGSVRAARRALHGGVAIPGPGVGRAVALDHRPGGRSDAAEQSLADLQHAGREESGEGVLGAAAAADHGDRAL